MEYKIKMISNKKPIIISFDGNIGSGKSSAVQYFKQNFEKFCNLKTYHYRVCFLDEPVEQWEFIIDVKDGKNAIQNFMKIMKNMHFHFK